MLVENVNPRNADTPKPEIKPKRQQPTKTQPNPGKPSQPNIGEPQSTPLTTPKRAML